MGGDIDDNVLEHLGHIRGTGDRVELDIRQQRGRIGNVEASVALISQRLDRTTDDMHEIRSRIGLIEA